MLWLRLRLWLGLAAAAVAWLLRTAQKDEAKGDAIGGEHEETEGGGAATCERLALHIVCVQQSVKAASERERLVWL